MHSLLNCTSGTLIQSRNSQNSFILLFLGWILSPEQEYYGESDKVHVALYYNSVHWGRGGEHTSYGNLVSTSVHVLHYSLAEIPVPQSFLIRIRKWGRIVFLVIEIYWFLYSPILNRGLVQHWKNIQAEIFCINLWFQITIEPEAISAKPCLNNRDGQAKHKPWYEFDTVVIGFHVEMVVQAILAVPWQWLGYWHLECKSTSNNTKHVLILPVPIYF